MPQYSDYGRLYAERSNRDRDKVRLYHRHWDGVDRPDYTEIALLDAHYARYLAQQLFAAAESIDGKSKRDRTMAKVMANTKRIAREAKKEATT